MQLYTKPSRFAVTRSGGTLIDPATYLPGAAQLSRFQPRRVPLGSIRELPAGQSRDPASPQRVLPLNRKDFPSFGSIPKSGAGRGETDLGSQSQARAAPLHTHPPILPPAFPARPSKRWALSGVARRRPPLLQLSPGEGSTQRQGCPASSGDRGRRAISRRLPRAIGGCWCGDE